MNKSDLFFDFSSDDYVMITTTSFLKNSIDDLLVDFNLDIKNICQVNQVHSDSILMVNKSKTYDKADGMISKMNSNLTLKIATADCIPIFIYDNFNFYGLIHAGWKGIVKKIHITAINRFLDLGSNPNQINIVLGPSIQKCCFEIKDDIIHEFRNEYLINKNDKKFIDLSRIIINDFCELGINHENIFSSNICSMHDSRCHSYRKNKTSNRMYSIIGRRQ